jgi:hypothetical protein
MRLGWFSLAVLTFFNLCAHVLDPAVGCVHDARQKKPRTNFIVLFADDMGYADAGFVRSARKENAGRSFTPNLDALAAKGVR